MNRIFKKWLLLLRYTVISISLIAIVSSCKNHEKIDKSVKIKNTTPQAKSVIQIWMWGGISHIDTFDPKPNAGSEYSGPLNKVIKTNAPDIEINATLPLLAKEADKYSIIRGMTHGVNAHETASYISQTGHSPGERIAYPSIGAVVSLYKGYDNGYKGIVPPYIVLTKGQGRFSESGILGNKYKPFVTGGDPSKDVFAVEGIVSKNITDDQQKSRRKLLHSLDALGKAIPSNKKIKQFDKDEDEAYKLMFGKAKEVFDLSKEDDATRERYGKNKFGQSCLVARRLVEEGVPYITINYNGWDTHKQHFDIMKRKLPEFDKGLSALLSDLKKRNLLDSTIVWCVGEFGRGPHIQYGSPWNGGRSHFGNAFSALIAGGGFKGGEIIGETDQYGLEVIKRKVHPADVIRSIYIKLGIDPDENMKNKKGLQLKVLPKAKNNYGILKEIM